MNYPTQAKSGLEWATSHKRDFRAELLGLLKKHGVEYDERYLFD